MFKVFIQYGSEEGKAIGIEFQKYLQKYKVDAFLSARETLNIPAGTLNPWGAMYQKLRDSQALFAIVTTGYGSSSGVKSELEYISTNRLNIPIIPAIKYCCRTPQTLGKRQNLKFDPVHYQQYFAEWFIEILRQVLISIVNNRDDIENILDVPLIQSFGGSTE